MKLFLKTFVLISIVILICIAQPAKAAETKGGLRHSITVTKFENRSSWHGQWNLGDA